MTWPHDCRLSNVALSLLACLPWIAKGSWKDASGAGGYGLIIQASMLICLMATWGFLGLHFKWLPMAMMAG